MHVIKTGTLHYVMMAKRKCQTISFDFLHLHKEKNKTKTVMATTLTATGNNYVKDKKAHKVIFRH